MRTTFEMKPAAHCYEAVCRQHTVMKQYAGSTLLCNFTKKSIKRKIIVTGKNIFLTLSQLTQQCEGRKVWLRDEEIYK